VAKKSTNGNSGLATIPARTEHDNSPQSNPRTSLDTCMKVLAGIQEQIRFADTKAAFIFGINSARPFWKRLLRDS